MLPELGTIYRARNQSIMGPPPDCLGTRWALVASNGQCRRVTLKALRRERVYGVDAKPDPNIAGPVGQGPVQDQGLHASDIVLRDHRFGMQAISGARSLDWANGSVCP